MSKTPIIFKIFASFISCGSIEITFDKDTHNKATLTAKGKKEGPHVRLRLADNNVLRKMTLNPELAIPEAYMDERLRLVDTSLDDFILFLLRNQQALGRTKKGRILGLLHRTKHLFSGVIRKSAAKANVAHHYDLTDRLYEMFLDDRRQYSCAYYEFPDDTLAQAQLQKIARLGAKLRIKQGAHILDVGCGWGELAYALSGLEDDVQVKGITLSENQLSYAKDYVATRADKPRVSFDLCDYREMDDVFDNIISVGMLEHVGCHSFDTYFKMISRCLKQDGTAVIHTIGKRRACPTTQPFITKYIFPGGYIPTLADLAKPLSESDLHIADIECLHNHYAHTLSAWRANCEAHKSEIVKLYDETFYRMWQFYLCSCEYFFRLDEGVVYQIQLIKTRDEAPSLRSYIAEKEQVYLKKLWQQNPLFGKPLRSQK